MALNVGIVLGFLSGIIFYELDDNLQWRLMFAMGCIMPIIMIILVQTVMPESPRFLVDKGQTEEAKEILTKLYPEGKEKQWNVVVSSTPERLITIEFSTRIQC
jgi:MFS family permease